MICQMLHQGTEYFDTFGNGVIAGGVAYPKMSVFLGKTIAWYDQYVVGNSFFDKICTTHDYEEDIQTIKFAASTGLRVCSGGILNMGETWKQRVELAVTLRELDVDSIPLNFLNQKHP